MDNKIRKKIISEYKKGKSSLQIVKIVGLSKPTILKVLNDEGLVRKRDRCKSLNIKQDERGYYVVRTCPKCKKEIRTYSKEKTIACRNHYKKINGSSLCKPCSLQEQIGINNPFYGKKHKKESLDKMTTTLTSTPRKFTSSSKPEKEIEKLLSELNVEVKRSHKIKEYICDIFIPSFNLIIEYNGDYWHCNPMKFDKRFIHPHKKKTSTEIWEEDKIRIDNLKGYGYNLEVVWESDYKGKTTLENIIKKYDKN
jgi:G:T-mismatch repair DNA endonuclease (very short patch repair protein)